MFELILQWVLTGLATLVLLAAIAGVILTIKDEWDMRPLARGSKSNARRER